MNNRKSGWKEGESKVTKVKEKKERKKKGIEESAAWKEVLYKRKEGRKNRRRKVY